MRLPQLRLARVSLVLLFVTLRVEGTSWAQIKPSLTVRIPMRDGMLLATDIYLPVGAGPWPVALLRTVFGKSGNNAVPIPRDRLVLAGNGVVAQDVRGLGDSEGRARLGADDGWGERQDRADSVAWIRRQPWSTGMIATFGSAGPGITQLLLAGAGP